MKKGFTLVEIMAVVTILFLLTVAIVPRIIKQVREKNDSISEANLRLIYDATELYVTNDKDTYKKEIEKVYCITLGDLVKEDLLDKNIMSFKTGKAIPLNRNIKITVNSFYEFEYELLKENELCE